MNSVYVCQESSYYTTNFKTDEERLKEAERLVKAYAKARLVITSRIHCALPCLGLETPVIYLEKTQDVEESSCRMQGLRELFNIVKVDEGILKPDFSITLPISYKNYPKNKSDWKELAYKLDKTCKNFINSL